MVGTSEDLPPGEIGGAWGNDTLVSLYDRFFRAQGTGGGVGIVPGTSATLRVSGITTPTVGPAETENTLSLHVGWATTGGKELGKMDFTGVGTLPDGGPVVDEA